jgi:hypothetical protein
MPIYDKDKISKSMVIYSKSFVLKAVVADFESFTNIGYHIDMFWLYKHSLRNFLRRLLPACKIPKQVQSSEQTVTVLVF